MLDVESLGSKGLSNYVLHYQPNVRVELITTYFNIKI